MEEIYAGGSLVVWAGITQHHTWFYVVMLGEPGEGSGNLGGSLAVRIREAEYLGLR